MKNNDEIPFFADKSVVGDYSPLYAYWKIMKEKKKPVDESLLKPGDFVYLKELIEKEQKVNLAVLLEQLSDYFIVRIDCDVAKEAYKRAYSVELDKEDACRRLAKILAGWLIEASKNTGLIKLSYTWKRT